MNTTDTVLKRLCGISVLVSGLLAAVFAHAATPTITSLNPNYGPAAGGTTVVITGTGFVKDGTTVKFGDTDVTSSIIGTTTSTQITVVSPAGTSGDAVSVTVDTGATSDPDGSDNDFTYWPAFTVGLNFTAALDGGYGPYRFGMRNGASDLALSADSDSGVPAALPFSSSAYFLVSPVDSNKNPTRLDKDFRPRVNVKKWLLEVFVPTNHAAVGFTWSIGPLCYVDAVNGNVWNAAADTIFRDWDKSGTYTTGDTILLGITPTLGTAGSPGVRDSDWGQVKTYDAVAGNSWDAVTDAIISDTDGSGTYTAGDVVLAGWVGKTLSTMIGKTISADGLVTDWNTTPIAFPRSTYPQLRIYQVSPTTTTVDANSLPVVKDPSTGDPTTTEAPELGGSSEDMLAVSSYNDITTGSYFVIVASTTTYTPPGELGHVKVTLLPQYDPETDPIDLGAKWKLTNDTIPYESAWLASDTVLELPATLTGITYTLTCKDVFGWFSTPSPDSNVTVTTAHTVGAPLTKIKTYGVLSPRGTVTTTLYPAAAITGGARWQFVKNDAPPYYFESGSLNSGATLTPTGPASTYFVTFDPVDGWTAPANITPVSVQASSALTYPRASPNQYETTYYGVVAAPTSITTTESGGTARIAVTLSRAPTADVTVTPSIIAGTGGDATAATVAIGRDPTTLTFTSTNWSTSQYITVTGADDGTYNTPAGGRSYQVQLAVTSTTDSNYKDSKDVGLVRAAVQGFTVDNDTAGINISQSVGLVTTEAGGAATVTVSLNAAPTDNVTVTIVSSDTSEGVVTSATDTDTNNTDNIVHWTFTTADWSTPQTLTITGQSDGILDGNVPYVVTLTFASGDANYNSQVRYLDVTNTDSQSPTVGQYDLVTFLPDSTVDFGQTTVGGSARYGSVTIFNGEASPVTLYVSTSSSSPFGVKDIAQLPTIAHVAGTAVTYTVAAGSMATVNLKYTPSGSPAIHEDSLTFQYNDGRALQTLKVITLMGETIASAPGGTLGINPSYAVARDPDTATPGSTDTVTVNVVLNSAPVAYTQCGFLLAVPTVVTAVSSATETTRTNGIAFSQQSLGGGVYAFDYADSSGTGITAGSGAILTLTLTVNPEGAAAAYPLTVYDITAVRSSTSYSVSPQAALLAVSSNLATLDVSNDATPNVNQTDVILCYRWAVQPSTRYIVSAITPPSWGASDAQKALYASRAQNLLETGHLDVSGDGATNQSDIILFYRWAVQPSTKYTVSKITPDSWGSSTATKTQYSFNVQNSVP